MQNNGLADKNRANNGVELKLTFMAPNSRRASRLDWQVQAS
jgi:hypothetical protein